MAEPTETVGRNALPESVTAGNAVAETHASLAPAPYSYSELCVAGETKEAVAADRTPRRDATLRTVLGRTSLDRTEAGRLQADDIVPLGSRLSDPVEIHAAGRLVARGELLVFQGQFCVRVTELIPPETESDLLSTGTATDLTETSA